MNRRWKYLTTFFAAYGPLLVYVLLIAIVKFFPVSVSTGHWINGFANFFLILGAVAAWVGIAFLAIPESFKQFTGMDEDEVREYVNMRKEASMSMLRNLRIKARQR